MKRLWIGLGVAIAMTFAGNAWAQVPPDVPPGHWAYDAIEELFDLGVLKGYPDGTFKGKVPLTRYEFAIAIRDALAAIRQEIEELRAQIPGRQQPGTQGGGTQGEVFTREEKEKLGKIPADTAERLQKAEEALARINRLATEFQDELASLGVDVESAKRDLTNLRRRVEAIEEELKRLRITGDVTFVVFASNGLDRRQAADLNNRLTTTGRITSDVHVLHELGLNIAGRLGEAASGEVSLVVGNWLPFLGSASQFVSANNFTVRPVLNNTDIVLYKATVNAPISLFGNEVNLTIGRFENRIHPLTLWRADVDAYTTIDRYDNGYYSMDGAKATIGFGAFQLGLFAAKNGTVNTNNGTNFMQVRGGILAATPLANAHPTVETLAGIAAFDQSAGVTLEANLGEQIGFSAEYVSLKATVPGPNRVDVFGGHLKANLIDRLTITADYAQSNLLEDNTSRNTKENWALLVGLGYNFSEDLSLKVGYREVRPRFAPPGYWGRIGRWYNPTDIRGVDVGLAWNLGAFSIDALGGFYQGTNRQGVSYFGNNEVTHLVAGVKWNLSEQVRLNVSYEGVLWNIKGTGGGKPTENYITLGADYTLGDNALLRVLYQVIDYNAKNVARWVVGNDNKSRGGVGVAQLSVKF